MDRRRGTTLTPGRAAVPVRLVVVAVLAAAAVASCSPKTRPGTAGRFNLAADYQGRQLRVTLPCVVQTQSVVAAAERVLVRRGLSVARSDATTSNGEVFAVPPGADPNPLIMRQRVRVRTGLDAGRTWVRVLVEPIGDEAESRSIMEQMLFELGL